MDSLPEGMKRCCRCQEVKPFDFFRQDPREKDGREYACRKCRSKNGTEYRPKVNLVPILKADYALIPFANKAGENLFAKVSLEDLERVAAHSWILKEQGYAAASIRKGYVYLHRFIVSAQEGQIVDHVNRDKMDNRRENLRFCTKAQNNLNKPKNCVHRHAQLDKWSVQVTVGGKRRHVGLYDQKEEAERAFSSAMLHIDPIFAWVPFPNETPKPLEQLRRENRRRYAKGTSQYFGVSKSPRKGWEAKINVANRSVYLGTFLTEEEAARAYDSAIETHGKPLWMKNFEASK